MKNRIPSTLDIMNTGIIMVYIDVIISIISKVFGITYPNWIGYMIIAIVALFIIYLLISIYIIKPLPGQAVYHPFNVIEVHISDTAEGDMRKVMTVFYETMVIAKAKEKDIIMSTWFFTPKALKERLKDAVTIYEPSKFDLMNGNRNKKKYKKIQETRLKNTGLKGEELNKTLERINKQYENPIINIHIDYTKITDELLNSLKRRTI